MADTIKFEVEIKLQDLAAYRQTGEESWSAEPISFSQAVVAETARQLAAKLITERDLREVRDRTLTQMVAQFAVARLEAVLAAPVRATNTYGEFTGAETTVTALVEAEILKQLQHKGGNYNSPRSVLDRVISETVNVRLETDLKAAFNTARTEMLNAAAEVGKKALQAAVSKAFT